MPANYRADDEQAMLKAMELRQAWMGMQNGILRIIFCILAILKVKKTDTKGSPHQKKRYRLLWSSDSPFLSCMSGLL